MPSGRLSTYDPAIAELICKRISSGESLRSVCRDEDMPPESTVREWTLYHDDFAAHYAKARERRADVIFDEILDIADDGRNDWMERSNAEDENRGWVQNGEHAKRSALRIDARKWVLGRMAPKKYGDKAQTEEPQNHVVRIIDETSG